MSAGKHTTGSACAKLPAQNSLFIQYALEPYHQEPNAEFALRRYMMLCIMLSLGIYLLYNKNKEKNFS